MNVDDLEYNISNSINDLCACTQTSQILYSVCVQSIISHISHDGKTPIYRKHERCENRPASSFSRCIYFEDCTTIVDE